MNDRVNPPESKAEQAVDQVDDARECLMDVVSHYRDFVNACEVMRAEATNADDASYWKKQVDVLQRMKAQAERALVARRHCSPAPSDERVRAAIKMAEKEVSRMAPFDSMEERRFAFCRALMAAHQSLQATLTVVTDVQRERVCEAVADALGEAYDCTRVWSAWRVGTMGPDDFHQVADDASRVGEIADAAINAMRAEVPYAS